MALRKQRSAYDGTRKRVCVSHTKPGGTAGILILSQQVIAGTGFFVFREVISCLFTQNDGAAALHPKF